MDSTRVTHRIFDPLVVFLVLAIALSACARKEESHGGEKAAASGHHEHVAPHGGTLVAVGDHQFNLELVHDAEDGRLTAYVLDAHAENFVRLPIQGFALIALVNGRRESLPLAAVGNPVTGETIGDTAEFAGFAEWLKGRVAFDAYIPAIDIRGTTFTDVRFAFRSPAPTK
ncbi:MAG: hypothetical protein IAE82_21455 [Opitutaceae bacterium]|nr:hypothetical protein [Opitutaceae bacterium]